MANKKIIIKNLVICGNFKIFQSNLTQIEYGRSIKYIFISNYLSVDYI